MQKIDPLALLLLFPFLQYGKLISYWDCKVTNSGIPAPFNVIAKKSFLETNDTGDPSLSSKNNIKDKTEEWFNFYSV